MNENTNPDDILNILVASDIHLGYNEKDPIRGEDSFKTFEEILSLGKERDVDLILLGGDLFHDSKPTQHCLHEALHLFRKYCMGDKPVAVEFLSDQSINFPCKNPVVNYEDPNLNVAIPAFSIHGNHDDPTGFGRLSSLDLLSASGLVNYFGKWTDLKQISITPLLMRKGETKLALYGLSYIKDERLCRLFRDRKVQLYQPKEDTDEWFNIFMLHQNRADRGINRSLPEDALPKFLNVVIWGHEHECRIVPEVNPIQHFSVIQPGSPVATSLCEGEAVSKHVGILKIYKKHFEFEPIKLRTVRPFVMDTVVLSRANITYISNKESEAVQEFLADHIHYMLDKAKDQISGHREQPVLPLIRLRVEYNDEKQVFNPLRFGLQFSSDCANPRDIILLKKERVKREGKDSAELDAETMRDILEQAREAEKVETVVEKYFADVDQLRGLQVLSVKGLNEAISSFIEKSDNDALTDLISHQLKKTSKFIKDNLDDDTNKINEVLANYRAIRSKSAADDTKEIKQLLADKTRKSKKATSRNDDEVMVISDGEDDDSLQASSSTGRGRGGRGRGRGRGGKQVNGTANKSRVGTSSATSGRAGGGRE